MGLVEIGIVLIKAVVVFACMLLCVAYMTWLERKVLGHMQVRCGPLRVGWHGLLQPIADGIKLLFKEDIVVSSANAFIYILSPMIVTGAAFAAIAVVPFGDQIEILGKKIALNIADVDIGVLYIFALSSLSVYGITLAGWSSNSKYALLGGLRSSAQMISYELPMGLSIIGVLMLSGSLRPVDIVESQDVWYIVKQPIGFLIFLICGFAECNRNPFDLPEAENELVAGFHVEYSSMKFALFFMAEYAHMIVLSALVATLFLGGWRGPVLPGVVWFLLKVFALLFFFVWVRATYPRFRYDQLMKFGWKVLFPVSLLNILVTGLGMVLWG
ncbi:MAG: NADH-quinone oxidoreductase subunit NuoH [Proteobacteria bacterium]|nr:NADH-quinone oxidoreductase subunit NuoH [Pseudomonadota bacterium]